MLTLQWSNVSGDLDIQPMAKKIFLYTPNNNSGHVCKYDADPYISLGGVCEITDIQTDTQIDRQTPLCY